MKAFKIIKNTLDVIAYIMAIILAIDVILLENGLGHLSTFVVYVLNYFV